MILEISEKFLRYLGLKVQRIIEEFKKDLNLDIFNKFIDFF